MIKETTQGVTVSVTPSFNKEHSDPYMHVYHFDYRIKMVNCNSFPVQLLKRQWRIFDSSGEFKFIEGDGVVGQQPVLYPGDDYEYTSACVLRTDAGTMEGVYTFCCKTTNRLFDVIVPGFEMYAPFKLN